MRNVYLTVILSLVAGILLIAGSFIYLDLLNHKIYHYRVQSGERTVGSIRIDRFLTEEKIIYKAVSYTPFDPQYTEYRYRLVLDKKYNLESYTNERICGRSAEIMYIENFKNNVSFVSRQESRFSFAENISVKRGTVVFEEAMPLTYLPMIENYDFDKGRSQGFNSLIPQADLAMPPKKQFVILTSIKDEYIKVDKRRIKTENLILRIRDYPQAGIWVAKSDRSIIRVDLPSKDISITRVFRPMIPEARQYGIKETGFRQVKAAFKGKGAKLAGTLSMPSSEGKFPAVLLVWGDGAQDRSYQGIFASIARYLAERGFCVLSFDKRGTGESKGELQSSTGKDMADDVSSALTFLAAQPSVDPGKIAVVAHSGGAMCAMEAAADTGQAKCLVLMAPVVKTVSGEEQVSAEIENTAKNSGWSKEYAALVAKTRKETEALAVNNSGSWAYILGKRCFLDETRRRITENPAEIIARLKVPVLILQGGNGSDPSIKSASYIDRLLADSGNPKHAIKYFDYLGPFMGGIVDDGIHRRYYEVDGEVLKSIKEWLDENL